MLDSLATEETYRRLLNIPTNDLPIPEHVVELHRRFRTMYGRIGGPELPPIMLAMIATVAEALKADVADEPGTNWEDVPPNTPVRFFHKGRREGYFVGVRPDGKLDCRIGEHGDVVAVNPASTNVVAEALVGA